MKKTISILLLFFVFFSMLSSIVGCTDDEVPGGPGGSGNNNKYQTRSKVVSYYHFNTVSSISTYGDTSEKEFNEYVKVADEMLGYYHKLFDIYFEYSGINNIRTINRKAGKSPVEVDDELIEFLLYCKELYTTTKGKTNIMMGSVLSIWHDVREIAEDDFGYLASEDLPTEAKLREAAEHTSIDLLVIDKENKTVYITDPKASIDVGAIAKGYAAQKLADKLKSMGADNMAINAGGNIITIGLRPDGSNWSTKLTNPHKTSNEDALICQVEMGETSIVTSGNYERYFICDGVRYHHIIDPVTLMPTEYFASVTIFTQGSGFADALSTALFCMSYEEGLALVNSIGGIDVIWIDNDGNMKYTPGLEGKVKMLI